MRAILVLAIVAFLASGCSSSQTAQAGARDPRKQGEVGPAISTVWGVLPSYKEPVMPRFTQIHVPFDTSRVSDVSTTVDVLVDGDGTVRAVALYRSSGYAEVDHGFLVACRTAVFPPMPPEFQSMQYVSRQQMRSVTSQRHYPWIPPGEYPVARQ